MTFVTHQETAIAPSHMRSAAENRGMMLDESLPAPLPGSNDITAGGDVYTQHNMLKGEHRLTHEYNRFGEPTLPPSRCIEFPPWEPGGDDATHPSAGRGVGMSYLIQIVYDGSEQTFDLLKVMATACRAIEIERYDDVIKYQGDYEVEDHRFLASFCSYLDATMFELFGNRLSGYNRSCVMVSDDEITEKELIQLPEEKHSVYLAWAEGTNRYKIGKSTTIKKRFKGLQTSSPYPIKLIHKIACVKVPVGEAEKALHIRYHDYRVHGEWFELPQDAVDYICSLEAL